MAYMSRPSGPPPAPMSGGLPPFSPETSPGSSPTTRMRMPSTTIVGCRPRKPTVVERTKILTVEDAILEFYATEKAYVTNLRRGYDLFEGILRVWAKRGKAIIKEADINAIFGQFKTIGDANDGFLQKLIALGLRGGIPAIRDGLGDEMREFAPLLKLYSDYIDKMKSMVSHLEKMRSKNKKFEEFCSVAEEHCGRSLQSYLEEPLGRLPMYLQLLANIYTAVEVSGIGDTEAGYKLFEAVDLMKKTIDDIAAKTKDKKARMFCGTLHRKLFKGKLDFSKPYRLVYRTGNVRYLAAGSLKEAKGFLILCNDIVLLTTVPKRGCKLLAVWPTFELRVVYDTPLPKKLKVPLPDTEPRFALITQNKRFAPLPEFGFVTFLFKSEKQVKTWTESVESAIDEEEHNTHPTNPIDLLARLKKQKLISAEGTRDKIDIMDPEIIEQIQNWRKARAEGIKLARGFVRVVPPEHDISGGGDDLSQVQRTRTEAPVGAFDASAKSAMSGAPPRHTSPEQKATDTPMGAPPPLPGTGLPTPVIRSETGSPKKPKMPATSAAATGGPPPLPGRVSLKTSARPKATGKRPKAGGLLSSIRAFDKSQLSEAEAVQVTENVDNALEATLKIYRQYVMEEDDIDDDFDEDWMD